MPDSRLSTLLCALLLACSDEAAPPGDTGPSSPPPIDAVSRGQYLADAVTTCTACHTPRDAMGAPILGQYLAGSECFIRLENGSCLNAPNLTNHETGLLNRTDAEIRRMIGDGIRPSATGDEPLFPVMPSFVLQDLTDQDLDSIVAYLRTVPGVNHAVPRSGPEFTPGPSNPLANSGLPATRRGGRRGALGPAEPLKVSVIPMPVPGYPEPEAALRGRYLATPACLICHTQHLDPDPQWLDYTQFFAGGEEFDVGLPTIAFAPNITPDAATGIADWSVEDIFAAVQHGTDKHGDGICPPMGGAPSGLTDADALDIAHYIKSLPPLAGQKAEACPFPPM